MTRNRGTETEFELTTIERLEKLGYTHIVGCDIDREPEEVVFIDNLCSFLKKRYPELTESALKYALGCIAHPDGVDTLRRNKAFHEMLTRGIEVKLELPGGREEFRHIYPIDWESPQNNEFLVVNQLPIRGKDDRRPDIVIYVNGLPLALFELKSPWRKTTVQDAYNQIQHYRNLIPHIFDFNCVTVISDGNYFEPEKEEIKDEERRGTLHGVWSTTLEWYAPWKSLDGENIAPSSVGSMRALVEGLFKKERFLSYIRDFLVFEEANEKLVKKGAKYHQFFAVHKAVNRARFAFTSESDNRRLGVIWHTTGSGKSLSMAFLVGILRRIPELNNPTIVIQVDATDLDDQLYDQFVAARDLVGEAKHADDIDELRDYLRTDGGELIFSTTQKFQRKKSKTGSTEVAHPVLSTRSNIIVIADEAHRSQYGFLQGYARYISEALPNAKWLGFTGTPVSLHGADTVDVFGTLIDVYDIKQAEKDRATVALFYLPRQIKLALGRDDVDAALDEITGKVAGEVPTNELERKKSRWAALSAAAGATKRVKELAQTLLAHYLDRSQTLDGKAMIVCMSRENCVKLFNALRELPNCPEVKIVMTANLSEDPPEWSKAGYYTSKAERNAIKERMRDTNDALKIVIVCDMWLTGTDIPCLHTLYVDKPMRGHTIIQAISRVNRVFRDKPHGLIVDFIGIGEELREATEKYTRGGGRGNPAPDISDEAKAVFFQIRTELLEAMPPGITDISCYANWRSLTFIELEDISAQVLGHLTQSDEMRDKFFYLEKRLTLAFLLVKNIAECRDHAEELIYFQRIRKELQKTLIKPGTSQTVEQAVKDLVDGSIETKGVIDIFQLAGIEKADISILDDDFLQTFKDRPHENLRLKLLEKLLNEEMEVRKQKNLTKYRSFQQLLQQTLENYHARLIDAAAVIKAMLEIRRDMEATDKRAKDLGLDPEEVAFYDAIAATYEQVYTIEFLRDLVHDVVQSVKRNLKIDWNESHREDVKAAVRAAVKRVLYKRDVKPEHLDAVLAMVMEQAEATFANWPIAA